MMKIPMIIATAPTIVCPYFTTSLGILAEPYNSVEDGEREGDTLLTDGTPEAYFRFSSASFARSDVVKFRLAPRAMTIPPFSVNIDDRNGWTVSFGVPLYFSRPTLVASFCPQRLTPFPFG